MVKIFGFWGWEMLAEVGKGFFMVARLGNWSFFTKKIWNLELLYPAAMGFLWRKRGLKSLAFEDENTTFKEEVWISHSCGIPRQRAWLWKFVPKMNSHKVHTRFAFLWNSHWDFGNGQRACIFENWHKSKFAQGMCCAKISHNRKCCAKIAESWFFSPVFPCFHHNFDFCKHHTCMNTSKLILKTY